MFPKLKQTRGIREIRRVNIVKNSIEESPPDDLLEIHKAEKDTVLNSTYSTSSEDLYTQNILL